MVISNRVMQDLLYRCVLSERKSRCPLCHVSNNFQKMTPKLRICHFWQGNDTQNSQEDASMGDYTSNCRLKLARNEEYRRKARNSKDELGAKPGNAAASYRSADGQS